VNPEITHSS